MTDDDAVEDRGSVAVTASSIRSGPTRAGRDWLMLVVFLAACLAAGGLGASLSRDALASWYPTLRKPSWNPPNWIFGPVWTALYLSMAVAAWTVWRRRDRASVVVPLTVFGVQLLLNAVWSPLFFNLRSPGLALIDISLLWAAVVATIEAFRRVSTVAAVLLVPYLAWVTFASALNAAIWSLNQ
ncbi:MAG: TspO/MBR family protein [Isosphaeraceae bacterium]